MADDDQGAAVKTGSGELTSTPSSASGGFSSRAKAGPSSDAVRRSLNDIEVHATQPDFVKALKAREAEFMARVNVGKRLDVRQVGRAQSEDVRSTDNRGKTRGQIDSDLEEDGPAFEGSTSAGGGSAVAVAPAEQQLAQDSTNKEQPTAEPEPEPDIPKPVPRPPSGPLTRQIAPQPGAPKGALATPGVAAPLPAGGSPRPGAPADPATPGGGGSPGAAGSGSPAAKAADAAQQQAEQQAAESKKPPVELVKRAAETDADTALGVEVEAGWWEVVAWAYGFCWLVFPVILLAIGLDVYWYFFHSSNPKRYPLDFEQRIVSVATNVLAALVLLVVTLLIGGVFYYMCQSWQVKALNLFSVQAPQKICTFFTSVTGDTKAKSAVVAGTSTGGPLNTSPAVLAGVGRAAGAEVDTCIVQTVARAETAAGKTPLEAESLAANLLQGVNNTVPELRANEIFTQYEALRGSPTARSLQSLYELCTFSTRSSAPVEPLNLR